MGSRIIRAVLVLSVLGASFTALPPATAVTSDEAAAEVYLFRLINRTRSNHDLRRLQPHAVMVREAREHSDDMADDESVSHNGIVDRKRRIADSDRGISVFRICEAVDVVRAFDDPVIAARRMIRKFLRSASDRRCILDGNGYTSESAGVGFEQDGAFWYATFIAADDRTP